MKSDTLVVQTIYRTVDPRCQLSMEKLQGAGYQVAKVGGDPCSSWAKNVAFSLALKNRGDAKILVHIDDDMIFNVEDVENLIASCKGMNSPVSGCYVDHDGELVGAQKDGLWLSGTGFFAVPFKNLIELARVTKSVNRKGHQYWAFTWAGPDDDGAWLSSDFRLCQKLGGVEMLPLRIGHLKPQVLYPNNDGMKEWLKG